MPDVYNVNAAAAAAGINADEISMPATETKGPDQNRISELQRNLAAMGDSDEIIHINEALPPETAFVDPYTGKPILMSPERPGVNPGARPPAGPTEPTEKDVLRDLGFEGYETIDDLNHAVSGQNDLLERTALILGQMTGVQTFGRAPQEIIADAERAMAGNRTPNGNAGNGQNRMAPFLPPPPVQFQPPAQVQQVQQQSAIALDMAPVFEKHAAKFVYSTGAFDAQGKPLQERGLSPDLRALYTDMASQIAQAVAAQVVGKDEMQGLATVVEMAQAREWHREARAHALGRARATAEAAGEQFAEDSVKFPTLREAMGMLMQNPEAVHTAFSRLGLGEDMNPLVVMLEARDRARTAAGTPRQVSVDLLAQAKKVAALRRQVPPTVIRPAAMPGRSRIQDLRNQLAREND